MIVGRMGCGGRKDGWVGRNSLLDSVLCLTNH